MHIDIDDPGTWPEGVRRHVEIVADRLEGTTEYTSDLEVRPEEEDEFRATLLLGHRLVAYHATRLLDEEVESIRTRGLVRLSEVLVEERIERAYDLGVLTDDERDELLGGNLFQRPGGTAYREDQVCLFISREVLNHSVAGIWSPLTRWGGEGIYFGVYSDEVKMGTLRALGRPAVVEALLDLADGWETHQVSPGVLRSLVGKVLAFEDYSASVLYRAPVLPEHIVSVWQPGDEFYGAHTELPRV